MGLTHFPHGVSSFGVPVIGGHGLIGMFAGIPASHTNRRQNIWFVDGDNGNDANEGFTPETAKATIQAAVTAAEAGGAIYIKARKMASGATDPVSYAEAITIAAAKSSLSLIGIPNGRTQGGLPQIRVGSGANPQLLVRAPGCLIANLGFNGAGATGGGIKLDDDGSTKTAFGTAIVGCHFKNCKGSTATDAATGGAVQLSGAPWQVLIKGCRFYKNVGDIVLLDTANAVPQDVVIEDSIFSGPAASIDCQLYLMGGSGMDGVVVRNNEFTAFPALGSGANLRFIKATACIGYLTGNRFASTGKTFGAAGTGALIPTTMLMTDNYQEDGTAQIVRT